MTCRKDRTFRGRAAALAVLLAVLGVWVWIEATPPPRTPPAAGQGIAIDKSPAAQSGRKAVIDKLRADGLLRSIEQTRDHTLRASLRPGFYLLDEAQRHEYADILYRYHFDGTNVNDAVTLRDARNGNVVGEYNPYRGGLKMYR